MKWLGRGTGYGATTQRPTTTGIRRPDTANADP
jgi:hypothetical protein